MAPVSPSRMNAQSVMCRRSSRTSCGIRARAAPGRGRSGWPDRRRAGRRPVVRGVGRRARTARLSVSDTWPVGGQHRAQRRRAEPVREVEMVDGRRARPRCRCTPGRVHARRVAQEGRAPRLVERGERRHAVTERRADDGGVLGEALRRCRGSSSRRRPAAVAEDPSGRASRAARCRARAARRRAASRSRARPGSPHPTRSGRCAARRSRSGTSRKPSSRHQRDVLGASGGSGRRRRHRWSPSIDPARGVAERVPDRRGRGRPRRPRLRSGTGAVAVPQTKPSGKDSGHAESGRPARGGLSTPSGRMARLSTGRSRGPSHRVPASPSGRPAPVSPTRIRTVHT